MNSFSPIVTPTDEDQHILVNPNPTQHGLRIVVVSLWHNARIAFKSFPSVSAVGPLRTKDGIDLLMRSLLKNPQIRRVHVSGPTAGPFGEETKRALFALWRDNDRSCLKEDIRALQTVSFVLEDVEIVDGREFQEEGVPLSERRGGSVIALPPEPTASATAPHGDPGERVSGDTLAEVWPMALARIMRFGREVPTQYGMTRELLNLISVIRDPQKSLEQLPEGLTAKDVEDYYHNSLTCDFPPAGASYAYGERMRLQRGPINRLLEKDIYARSAYLSTWRPESDSGSISQCPCLVGVMFRAVPDGWRVISGANQATFWQVGMRHLKMGRVTGFQQPSTNEKYDPSVCGDTWVSFLNPSDGKVTTGGKSSSYMEPSNADLKDKQTFDLLMSRNLLERAPRLHLTAMFRSHDLHGAYPANVAGLCMWLVDRALKFKVDVGTVTCVSTSAHIYKAQWDQASEVVSKMKHKVISWDQRSSFLIERTATGARAIVFGPGPNSGDGIVAVLEGETKGALRMAVERSGLCTSIGNALYVGSEIERVFGCAEP